MMWGYGQAPFMEQGGWGLGLGMGVGLLLHLGFWGAVIVGGAVLVRSLLRKSHRTRGADDSAVGILGRRYAAGELTKEEYEQRLHVLAPR
ncbi:MAG: SHOCT domain-containing protein [Chloroflexi bacterium]|nr:SHOCT domain-containing protein [Chloroflexota bacterium]